MSTGKVTKYTVMLDFTDTDRAPDVVVEMSSLDSGEKEHDDALKGVGVLCVRLSFRNRGRSSTDLKIEGSVSVATRSAEEQAYEVVADPDRSAAIGPGRALAFERRAAQCRSIFICRCG
jgi:hypothetical protein